MYYFTDEETEARRGGCFPMTTFRTYASQLTLNQGSCFLIVTWEKKWGVCIAHAPISTPVQRGPSEVVSEDLCLTVLPVV